MTFNYSARLCTGSGLLLMLFSSAPLIAWESSGGWGGYAPPGEADPRLHGWRTQPSGLLPPSGGDRWRPSGAESPHGYSDRDPYDPTSGTTRPPQPQWQPQHRETQHGRDNELIGGYRFRRLPQAHEPQSQGEFHFRPDHRIEDAAAPPRSANDWQENWSNGWSGPPPTFRPQQQRHSERPPVTRSQGTLPPPLPTSEWPIPERREGERWSPGSDESFYPFTWDEPRRP